LIIGAMTRIMGLACHKISANSWIGRMLVRKPKMLVGIAPANKMARQIWAMLSKKEGIRRWQQRHEHRAVSLHRRCQGECEGVDLNGRNDRTNLDRENQ
jgi:hypothetical protein